MKNPAKQREKKRLDALGFDNGGDGTWSAVGCDVVFVAGADNETWELQILLPNDSKLVCRPQYFLTKTAAEEEWQG
jgi:hypothetical protein